MDIIQTAEPVSAEPTGLILTFTLRKRTTSSASAATLKRNANIATQLWHPTFHIWPAGLNNKKPADINAPASATIWTHAKAIVIGFRLTTS